VDNDDPFVMNGLGLSAAAPAFNPNPSWHQPPPPPPDIGGSSGASPEGDSAPSSSSRDTSGNGHRANEGRSNGSSSREGQSSDDNGPVIVNGSTPSNKGKQPVGTDPMAGATRFICVPNVQADDFDPNMLFGRVKALVSKPHFLELTAVTDQHCTEMLQGRCPEERYLRRQV